MYGLSGQFRFLITKGLYLSCLLLLASFSVTKANRDSLLAIVNGEQGEYRRIQTLIALGALEMNHENFTTSLQFYQDAKELYHPKQDWALNRQILFGLWEAYYELGMLDSARAVCSQIYDLCQLQEDPACLIAHYNNRALLYKLQFQMDSATIVYQEGLKIAEALSDTANIALLYSNMGITFGMQGQLDQALTYFYHSYRLAKGQQLHHQTITAQVNIGRTFIELGQLDSALFHLTEAKILAEHTADNSSLRAIMNFQGRAALKKGQFELARSNFESLLAFFQRSEQLVEAAEVLTCLTELHLTTDNLALAEKYCDEGLRISEELQLNEFLQALSDYKSRLLAKQGRFEESLGYLRNYQTLRDSFLNVMNTNKMAEVVAKYDAVKRDNENHLLRREKEQQESKAKQRTYLAIAFGALSLLIAALFGFRYRMYLNQKRSRIRLENTVTARTEELRQINEQLQHSNQELRSFAYIASHDLKEPLRSISGFTSLLERRLQDHLNEETKEYMSYIKKNTAHLHALIGDVLAYSLLTKDSHQVERIQLRSIVQEVNNNLAELVKRKRGLIDCAQLPNKEIQANYHHLFLIFKNLIENGLKYNHSSTPTVWLKYEEEEESVCIHFSDNGIGIESNYHERIFELFKRLHNREKYQGTGMGLALSQKIAHRMGGQITVDSQVGEGSTFYLILPKYQLAHSVEVS